MSNTFDVGIVGAGVSGSFAAYKIAKDYKLTKIIIFDIGRPPAKRRRQLEGWLGVLPNSDGKLYLNDIDRVSDVIGLRKSKSCNTKVNNLLSNIADFKTVKDKSPSVSMEKKLKKFEYNCKLNDYIQMYPKDIHSLSKYMADYIETTKNVTFSFDNEVFSIMKQKGMFLVQTQNQEFKCKKILVAVGRSGWRWAHNLFKNFGIIENNEYAKFGIRIELPSSSLKDFNKSNCTLTKGNLEIGPFSWFGTVIPEDHVDLAISAFRSNENRWKTDKVSFSLIGNISTDNIGAEQTDRIGQLTFVLANDRIIKEKVSSILSKKSKISDIKEYDWLSDDLNELSNVIPDLLTKAYFHVPTILPLVPKINIGDNLETEVGGMFVAGESAGVPGLLSAALMGFASVDGMLK